MIGSNFEILEPDIQRVGWIQSDGKAYIDLEYSFVKDSRTFKTIEVDLQVLNGVNDAPGYVLGTRVSDKKGERALKIEADIVTYYKALEKELVKDIWNGDAREEIKNGYVGKGTVWTNIEGQVTRFVVSRLGLARVNNGPLEWDLDASIDGFNYCQITYPLTNVEESFSWITDSSWQDRPEGFQNFGNKITIIDSYTYYNETLNYTESFNMETGEVRIFDNQGQYLFKNWRYAYPELRKSYTQLENHREVADCQYDVSLAIRPMKTGDPFPYIANGCRHKVFVTDGGGGVDSSGYVTALEIFLVDRTLQLNSEHSTIGDIYEQNLIRPEGPIFLFAKNDGFLNPIGVNPSLRVYGVKCLTINEYDQWGKPISNLELECTRNLLPVVKTGVGAGLYDILAGKFYPAKGGTMLYGGTAV